MGMVAVAPAAQAEDGPQTPPVAEEEVLGLMVITDSPRVDTDSLEETVADAGGDVEGSTEGPVTVIDLDAPISAEEAEPLAEALEARPDVVAVEYDRRVYLAVDPVIPNDPYMTKDLWGNWQQWNMWAGGGTNDFGTRAAQMWGSTKGSSNVVVGVIDTGYTDHPDLVGTTVPGFDFISDGSLARDGNGWDADPRDLGDWCRQGRSSWHGTHVAGIVNALQGDGQGVTGLAPEVKVQHLRAVGACGGTTSDVLAAVVWGSGGSLNGVSPNPTPAKVLNLSLGSTGSCDALHPVSRKVFAEARARGTTIVAAAGNEARGVKSSWPANCPGVISVVSSTKQGGISSFSNVGDGSGHMTVTAPGASIWSTYNAGAQAPGAPAYAAVSGTSMAAPHVAAAAAVLYSLGLTSPGAVEKALSQSVRPLSATPTCQPIRYGVGILDVGRLRDAALGTVVVSRDPAKPGKVRKLSQGRVTKAAKGFKTTVTWTPRKSNGGQAVSGYCLRYGTGGKWTQWSFVKKNSTVLKGLKKRTTYKVQVRAMTVAGLGPQATLRFRTPR